MTSETAIPITKFQKALLHWCETDDKCELIRFTLHAYSQPSRNAALRKSLILEPFEENELRKVGLLGIREQVVEYINGLANGRDHRHANEFILKNALFANGICCRNCLSVCHSIPYWKKITSEEKDKLANSTMKWINKKSMSFDLGEQKQKVCEKRK